MQIKPVPMLSGIVKHFLILENADSATLRIFSDGNTGLVLNTGNPLYLQECHSLASESLPQSFIYGQLDAFQNIFSAGKIRLVIAVLHPFGAPALLRLPAAELKNQIIDVNVFQFLKTGSLLEQMQETNNVSDKISCVENFLLSALRQPDFYNPLITSTVKLIDQYHGSLSVSQLATTLHVHERQLQRKFEEYVGISPKRYSGIARIQYFLKLLRKNASQTSLAGTAFDSGFYDQAHLNRELKNISGLTPGEYVNGKNLLAANLIQLSR